jgi:DNA repair protein RadA/Sms
MLQVAAGMAAMGEKLLYVSAEESQHQIMRRAGRLGIKSGGIYISCASDVEEICGQAESLGVSTLVIDSIQIVRLAGFPSAAGSVSQVRECALFLMEAAKRRNVTVFVVGHVTKSGDIAGPRMLEHMVDVVLYFEGERQQPYRILRTWKNRFGSTEEVGIFSMGAGGLEQVDDPSRLFIQERRPENPGSVVSPSVEGRRPILVEIQALAGGSAFNVPQRRSLGVDYNRLCMVIAVLERYAGLKLRDRDLFVSVAGGLNVTEPAVDLAVAVAVASSVKARPVDKDLVVIGEVGLSGEIRRCHRIEHRLKEAGKLGFKRAMVPASAVAGAIEGAGPRVIPVDSLKEAIGIAL